MRAVDAVISQPTNVPRMRRGLFGAITLMAWTVFGWLLTPAVTLVLWLIGVRTAWDTTLGPFGSVDPVLAALVFTLSAVAACALLLWAELQRRRFTGIERRLRAPDATPEEVADELGCDPETAGVLRGAKVASLRLRADGSPEAATPLRIPRPRRPADAHPTDEHPAGKHRTGEHRNGEHPADAPPGPRSGQPDGSTHRA